MLLLFYVIDSSLVIIVEHIVFKSFVVILLLQHQNILTKKVGYACRVVKLLGAHVLLTV